MAGMIAPSSQCGLVAPERERQHLAWIGDALKPFDGYEAVDAFEFRPQLGGEIEIVLSPALDRQDLEDDGDHRGLISMDGNTLGERTAQNQDARRGRSVTALGI
jgi:hypothetical protein